MASSELHIIRRIGDIISECAEHHEGLRLAAEYLAERLHADACSILGFNEITQQLIMEATYGLGQDTVHRIRLEVDEGITGHCFATGQIVNTGRMTEHPAYVPCVAEGRAGLNSLVSVPLVAGGRRIGVLNLWTKRATRFPDKTISLLQTLANPLAVFLRSSHLTEYSRAEAGGPGRQTPPQLILYGTPITDRMVRGRAYFLVDADVFAEMSLEYSGDIAEEKALFQKVVAAAREDTIELQREAELVLAETDAAIFYVHLLLLEDPALTGRIDRALDQGFKLRYALKVAWERFEEEVGQLATAMARERLADIKDVILRMYQAVDEVEGVSQRLKQQRRVSRIRRPIVVTRELLPSQLIRLPLINLAGVVCEQGGMTSHAAILARTLQLPMLVGAKDAMTAIRKNDDLVLDCATGQCFVRPPRPVIRKLNAVLRSQDFRKDPTRRIVRGPALTADGTAVRLGGNVSLINEFPLLELHGAEGVGLYRPDFLFLIRNTYPGEDEQYAVFRQVVSAVTDTSVTIRLLDIGGDKLPPYMTFGREDNPALGLRGTRFLLSRPEFLDPHLRAILRTTVHGYVNILLPMVSCLEDLLEAREAIDRAADQLRVEGTPFEERFRIGIMLEIPAAFWSLPQMLPHVDFVSIGTNDLVQYMFAADRANNHVRPWFRQCHPVILNMIKQTCEQCAASKVSVSLCGELAGNPLAVPFLIGAGLRFLSMNPWRIPDVRDTIAEIEVKECRRLLGRALRRRLDSEVVKLMHEFGRDHHLTVPPPAVP